MKQNKFIVPIILIIILTIVIFIGLTYAYFDLTIKAEESSTMTIGGAEISANFVSTNSITIEEALPGDSPIGFKDFSITTKNTSNNSYKLYLKTIIYNNTFIDTENDGVLYYDIYSGTNHDTLVQTKTLFPTISKGKAILKELTIPAKTNETTEYRLNLYFPESDKVQNKNGRLILNAQITVENTNETSTTVPALPYQVPLASYLSINSLSESFNNSNGIEIDDTDDKNVRYVGATPKNYIKFNNETWRIIGVFNDITTIDENGNEKKESLVKIIRDESLGEYSLDSSATSVNSGYGINEWSQADLMTELNNDYINTSKTSGTTSWYNGKNNSKTGTYDYSNNIKSAFINKIITARWNLGGYSSYNPNEDSVLKMYNVERGILHISTPSDGVTRTNFWNGKIALMYPSDYGYASTDTECRENLRAGVYYNAETNTYDFTNVKCKNNNWLYKNSNYWLLTPHYSSDNVCGNACYVFFVRSEGIVAGQGSYNSYGVRPVLFLKSDIKITNGTGEKSNPYILE